ncbi:MAG: type II secretion system secretin GspD [Rhodanobacteraceae bacterium]
MPSRLKTLLLVSGLAMLAGCGTQPTKPGPSERNSDVLTPDSLRRGAPRGPVPDAAVPADRGISLSTDNSNYKPTKPEIEVGTGKFFKVGPVKSGKTPEGQVVFNFENQPIQAVVKAILGDLLQENYSIAPNVGGNVTFSTSKPIRPQDAMPVLEMLLSWTGNTLVHENGRYTVLQVKDAIPGKLTPNTAPPGSALGYELRIFPLKYISPSEMAKLLKPYAKPEAFVSVDTSRSLLVMAGTASELENYQRTIDTFDVDWLAGMSVGVYTLQHVDVDKLMPDLEKIFGSAGESPLAGMFRFMPIEQTNAIIAITPQPEYLAKAAEWLHRLDQGGSENATQLYVYDVKNIKAPDLADYLSQIFLGASGTSHRSSTSGNVGQGLHPVTVGGIGGTGGNLSYGSRQNSPRPQSKEERNSPVKGAAAVAGNKDSDIRITAVEENNQLLVMSTPLEWDSIQSAIRRLDIAPLQVHIEAKILEVTLTGNLQFGVQWYLAGLIGTADGSAQANGNYPYAYPPGSGPTFTGNSHDRHRASLGATGNVGPTGDGGFFYSFLNKNFEVAINALETSGQARSLSAPSLVVLNNQEAQINVGTQIPVVQTYISPYTPVINTGNTGTGTSGVNNISGATGSVQYLNTGVMLDVKPRVNPGGLVYMEIQQEVSNPGPETANRNPPINQRQFSTQIAVQSGQTVLLGGLIRDNDSTTDNGIPLLSRIPIVGKLFGNTKRSHDRTELIVLLTPQVITNSEEAREVTEEYQRKFQSLAPLRAKDADQRPAPPSPQQPPPSREPAQTRPPEDSASDN